VTSRQHFARLETLFHRLADLPDDERDAELAALRDSDRELHDRVVDLLALDRDSSDEHLRGSVRPLLDTAPETIGPYRLLRRLGEGGMGVVYEAEQSEPVTRRVALKLVRSLLGGDEVVRRFEAERQALAVMSHPAIAQVHDAGTAPDGRPYVVMELVEGLPITAYCDRERLPLRDRLELFVEVCEAVQHAHQKGIIHRDLKPSNILVARAAARHRPKVIDFGIAKAVDGGDLESPDLTRFGEVVGTLEYMSPEQTRGSGAAVDTRCDVYSLGVVLYELLAGVLPLSVGEMLSAGVDEVRRLIREQEPARPSTRVALTEPSAAAAARQRCLEPATLVRSLRGDLDWVTMCAIDKEPERRYGSAAALAEDLRRHLRHEPVLAGPPSARYRAGKFVRRHRAAVTAAALIAIALLLGTVGTAIGLVQARRAATEARHAEAEARHEAEVAERVSAFLVGLFQSSDPEQAQGDQATAQELLERGVERLRGELTEEPLIRARLLHTLGNVQRSLGRYEQARGLLEEAVELRRQERGPAHPEVLDTLVPLANTYDQLGLFERAEQTHRTILERAQQCGAACERQLGMTYLNLGNLTIKLRRPEEALDCFERARRHLVATDGPEHDRIADVLIGLGIARRTLGDLGGSREAYLDALSILERTRGTDHPSVGLVLNNLAVTVAQLGNLAEARQYFERGMAITEKVYGTDHPRTADRYLNHSAALRVLGDLEAAAAYGEQALEVYRTTLGPDHHRVPLGMVQLAKTHLRSGAHEEARTLLEQALELTRDETVLHFGSTALEAARDLSVLERWQGRPVRAAALTREALTWPQAAAGVSSLEVELACALAQAGEPTAARRQWKVAEEALGATPGPPFEASLAAARFASLIGDRDRALEQVEAAVDSGLNDVWLADDPDFTGLHDEPRFAAAVARMSTTMGL
jgi:non-specific serine/threonine protein kinase/serine/threonine-protein kinase